MGRPIDPTIPRTGIYTITNKLTGRFYIGSTIVDFPTRKGLHLSNLRKGRHGNPDLQKDWIEFGESAFEFCVLERIWNEDRGVSIARRETELINQYYGEQIYNKLRYSTTKSHSYKKG